MNVSAQEKAACGQRSAVAQHLTAAKLASMDQGSVHIRGAPDCLWHRMPSAYGITAEMYGLIGRKG